jgi:hypothetical protein
LERLPDALIRSIQDGDCVAFLGAGFTAAAQLPGWKPLLTRIAAGPEVPEAVRSHVAERVARGSAHALDEAAQALDDALGRARFLELLAEVLAHPETTPAMEERLRWLRGIPFRAVLTTNFDGVLPGPSETTHPHRLSSR